MKIFVKNKDIRNVVRELREIFENKIEFDEIRLNRDFGLFVKGDFSIEIFRFTQGARGHKSDIIVYDDDITYDEHDELILPMGVRDRSDEVDPIFLSYSQFIKLIKLGMIL